MGDESLGPWSPGVHTVTTQDVASGGRGLRGCGQRVVEETYDLECEGLFVRAGLQGEFWSATAERL
jgi:hypothetical protein